jgi:hypothetical protein
MSLALPLIMAAEVLSNPRATALQSFGQESAQFPSASGCAARPERRGPSAGRIDKSVLTFSEPKRRRDKAHLRYVVTQPCLVCGRQPSDPHHLRFAQARPSLSGTTKQFMGWTEPRNLCRDT